MEEVAVTATRVEKDVFRTPNAISVISQRQIGRINAGITPRLLRETVGVWVQQTTVGQGSPLLRGLTGYQTFIQLDGVRLNNSTFRSGPNQYLATISPDNLDRIEVLRGPGSTQHGSGAMGGGISLFTKDPTLNQSADRWNITPRLSSRLASATSERLGRIEVLGNRNRLGFIAGFSARSFGNINAGRGYDLHYKNRKFEIVTDKPAGVKLFDQPPKDIPDKWLIDTQKPLGWAAYDGNAKIAYQLDDSSTINLAYQLWRQPQTPRYDKIAPGQYDEFDFKPQNRDLIYATYSSKEIGLAVDRFQFTASYHRQKEGRSEVKHSAVERRQQLDTVNTLGISTQIVSTLFSNQRLVTGGEFYYDILESQTIKTDLKTGAEQIDQQKGRFIDGSQFWDANLFVQDEIELHDRVELTLGNRLTFFHTKADLSIREPGFDEYSESGSALTGNAGLVVGLTDQLNFVANVATSFRAPSLNDTTAVEVTNEGIDAPSPGIDSEKGWTVESGLKARYPRIIGSITFFHSRINDLVTRVPVQEAYSDQTLPQLYQDIQTANPGIDIFVFDNVDEVQIQGIEITATVPIRSGWSVYGNSTLTRGKVLLLNGKDPDPNKPWEKRIRREPPLNGVAGIRWMQPANRFWGEFFVRGASKQDRLSRGDIRDPRIPGTTRDTGEIKFDADGQAIAQGTPGWVTLNLRGGIQISGYSRLTISLENLLDKRYREHGTGVDAPGLNVVVSINSQL
jgi:iron complex outermembrane receptor protein/hemoglobin/transferrin/lactoferrin receptor protein